MGLQRVGSAGSASNPPCAPTSAEALLEVMDEYGVEHALVHHALAKENSAALGNQMLGQAIARNCGCIPAGSYCPRHLRAAAAR